MRTFYYYSGYFISLFCFTFISINHLISQPLHFIKVVSQIQLEEPINYCIVAEVPRNCTANEAKCNNTGYCILEQHVCDLVDDCGDGTDESDVVCCEYNRIISFPRKTFMKFFQRIWHQLW